MRNVKFFITSFIFLFFFFNDTATPEIYPLSLHDALPISAPPRGRAAAIPHPRRDETPGRAADRGRAARAHAARHHAGPQPSGMEGDGGFRLRLRDRRAGPLPGERGARPQRTGGRVPGGSGAGPL